MAPQNHPQGPWGDLFVIGGAEDKLRKPTVLREFVEAAGGEDARIAVVPTASSLGPEIIDVYRAVFTRLGAESVVGVRPETRTDASLAEYVDPLREVTGIFMTGGNQLKLSSVISGTTFGDAIREAHAAGVAVGGTSAGASIQSSHMVAFGVGGATPKQRMTQVAAGLGLIESCVIDQHFEQRNRYGRLLMIVAQNPQLLGIGVDEDTAAVVSTGPRGADGERSEVLRVVGRGAVTILDAADMVTNAFEAPRNKPLLASGVKLHVLPAGAHFNLATRALIPVPPDVDASAADDLALANRDLRKLARDIAAADISPTALRRRMARRTKKESS